MFAGKRVSIIIIIVYYHVSQDIPDNSSTDSSRPRRYFHSSGILVSGAERVVYQDNLVLVKIGDTVIHSFPSVQVLQVYNDIEGSLSFYGTANDRVFPGYGIDTIMNGIRIIISVLFRSIECGYRYNRVYTGKCSITGNHSNIIIIL